MKITHLISDLGRVEARVSGFSLAAVQILLLLLSGCLCTVRSLLPIKAGRRPQLEPPSSRRRVPSSLFLSVAASNLARFLSLRFRFGPAAAVTAAAGLAGHAYFSRARSRGSG